MIYARIGDITLLRGIGLDDVLDGSPNIVVLDDEYADIYGEYSFLGYEVYAPLFETNRADVTGLFEAAVVLTKRPLVIVCGDRLNERCLYGLAASLVLQGRSADEALREAWGMVSRLYPGAREPRNAFLEASLYTLERLYRLTGKEGIAGLVALGNNYGYGWGLRHYNESLVWAWGLDADDHVMLAVALHFLVEGPGEPLELLMLRRDAIGDNVLDALTGGRWSSVQRVLEEYAKGVERGRGAALRVIEELGPGSGEVLLVWRGDGYGLVKCRVVEGAPSKQCVERVGRASEVLVRAEGLGARELRIEPVG